MTNSKYPSQNHDEIHKINNPERNSKQLCKTIEKLGTWDLLTRKLCVLKAEVAQSLANSKST